ncbi:MAG: amidohydrolase family protein [Gemmatimonadota bacterium]
MRRILVVAAAAAAASRPTGPADLILRNTAVYTMVDRVPKAQAVAIRAGKVVYVGDNAGAEAWAGDSTEALDLAGRMVLPGFHDTHVHLSGGVSLDECTLDGLTTQQAVVDSVKRCAAAKPDTTWLRGRGWALPVFPNANPRREWLDQVVAARPAFLVAADGHSAWASTKALALAGITKATVDPPNGRIERDPRTGEPSGTLRESAMDLVETKIPPRTAEELKKGLRRGVQLANSFGITTVHEASMSSELAAAYATLDREHQLTARAIGAFYVDPVKGVGQVDSMVALRKRFSGGTYFRPTAAKIFADGVIEAKTAALLASYSDGSTSRGMPNFRPALLDSIVEALDRAAFQVHIHAIGDGAIRMSLDALEKARKANGPRDARPIIAHLELFDPADIPRFKQIGVIASFQPLWAYADEYITQLTEPILGPARSRWLYPIASVVKTGATVAAGSDWTVSSMNPLEAIQVAITRRAPTDSTAGPPWIPEEVVDLTTMLKAYTVAGARAAFDETIDGTIEVGKAADLVVLDRDLYKIPPHQIHRAKVLLTLLDGREVYRDRALP